MISISLFYCCEKVFPIRMYGKFNESSLPEKDDFYSHRHLNMEHINDADCTHAKKVCKDFKIRYHDLYFQSDTLLLADVFENFRNMCLKMYELDPAHFLFAPGLA